MVNFLHHHPAAMKRFTALASNRDTNTPMTEKQSTQLFFIFVLFFGLLIRPPYPGDEWGLWAEKKRTRFLLSIRMRLLGRHPPPPPSLSLAKPNNNPPSHLISLCLRSLEEGRICLFNGFLLETEKEKLLLLPKRERAFWSATWVVMDLEPGLKAYTLWFGIEKWMGSKMDFLKK